MVLVSARVARKRSMRGAVARGGRLGQARGDLWQRELEGRKPALGPRQQINLLLLTLLLRRTMLINYKCCRPAVRVMRRVTFAKRWQWAESGLLWLGRDQLVGVLKEGKIDSSAPRCTAHIAATQRLALVQGQARVAHAH